MALDADQALRAAAEAAGGAGHPTPWLMNRARRGRLGTATAAHAAGVPPVVLWSGDDRRTKQELVAWARAVASMVVRDYSMRPCVAEACG